MDDLIDEFLAETREMLQALSDAVVAWEADPGDRSRIDEIFRFVHTVKGNSGFFDLPRLQRLSHAAEDVLAAVRSGERTSDPDLVSAVLTVIDRIGDHVAALEAGEPLPAGDDEDLISFLVQGHRKPAAEDEAGSLPADRRGLRSIRLSIDLLDRMMSGVSDAVLARNELARKLRESGPTPALEDAFERLSACIGEVREAVTRTRMQRIDSLFSALPRMVRDLGLELGKQVRLEIDGGDVELDREMIEMIRDPLTHIIRNAVDHGLEASPDRLKAGKGATGRLKVSARQAGNQILIEISDDGRGIDPEALVRRAIAAGAVSAERAEQFSLEQKLGLMFAAGVSTAGAVTAISGRGVGMDVVRTNIERIGGLIDIDSRPGEGLKLCIRIPLTLTIIPALTVSAGGLTFAIPRSAIEEILNARGPLGLDQIGESRVVTVRGRRVPLVVLAGLLDRPAAGPLQDGKIVLLKPAGSGVYALAVDAVHDHEELVVKPAAPAIMACGFYAGTTLADDGRPVLLLDASGIAHRAGVRFDLDEASPDDGKEEASAKGREVNLLLFRTLDDVLRAVPVALVERIEDVEPQSIRFTAGRLRLATGDSLIPLAGLGNPPAERVRILRLTDGSREIAYGFGSVVDIRSVDYDLKPAAAEGEIAGVALIDGEQVEMIDMHWLFANHLGAGDGGRVVTCALPSGDPWIDNMLRPLIESLGYRVVAADAGIEADILVAAAESEPDPAIGAGKILYLRTEPEALEPAKSIYRYDRAALIAALSGPGSEKKVHG